MKTIVSVLHRVGLAGAFAGAIVASALPSGAHSASFRHPVRVVRCDADRGGLRGYTPGYYPGGSYFWPDVYGYSYYQAPLGGGATLGIDYSNATHTTMRAIEFGLVVRGELLAEVRDVGTFSPGAQIRHKFGLSRNVFPLRTSFTRCVPLHITFANGKSWTNPHLPALRRSIYRRRR